MVKCLFLFLAIIAFSNGGFSDEIEVVKAGPFHEAYITSENGSVILDAISIPPPQEIKEKRPKGKDPYANWISGYWAWSKEFGSYLWVSGIWRRSPPGQTWIPGYWKEYREGWVRFKGFWSPIVEEEIRYIDTPPPDVIEENVSLPEDQNLFWIPGYWDYSFSDKRYRWIGGVWEPFDEEWVYIPAHYYWRKNGYIFIPAFWDFPLEERGFAYASVFIPPEMLANAIEKPSVILDPLFIVESLYPNWPNYSCLFQFHYFIHNELWKKWGGAPPWWDWKDWWSLDWQNQWGLWWWWSHPGFPAPLFIDENLANSMAPPPEFIVNMMKQVSSPLNITQNGAVGSLSLLKAIRSITGSNIPIMPSNREERFEIQKFAGPKTFRQPLLPKGKKDIQNPPLKPNLDENSQFNHSLSATIPEKPDITKPPKLRTEPRKPPSYKPPPEPYIPKEQPPEGEKQVEQKPKEPVRFVPGRYDPAATHVIPPPNLPPTPIPPPPPGYPIPDPSQIPPLPLTDPSGIYHGRAPNYEFPQTPMGIEPHDSISTEPHLQINPAPPVVDPQLRGRVRVYRPGYIDRMEDY